ncbi:AfsR/SARP family transcriptional regulator [Actinomadura kijaniata]|uniref:AfsR/SARP family transcriptional regulator n=1 Tax=Actinomadura kijaniata TaxID=46161 RepID=UPI003F1AB12F
MGSSTVSIQVLGPFSASLGDGVVTPNAAKQRQVLAVLGLNARRVVSVSTLSEEIWGGHPPRSSTAALQTYIFHLRNRLAAFVPRERVARELLRTSHNGYQLECRTDVEDFHQLAQAGRKAMEAGDPQAASGLLGRALALWRGPALADVRQGRVLETEAASLEETRLGVLERRIQADLVLNRDADILGELTGLVARYPMHENFWGLLMTALYRSGHVARALDAFRRLNAILDEELGVGPSLRLQRLHQAMLSGDPAEDVAAFLAQAPGRSGAA